MMLIRISFLPLLLLSSLSVLTMAQSGGSVTVEKSIVAAGGTSQGGGFILYGVLGQSIIGSSAGDGITVSGGFIVPQFVPTAAGLVISGRVLSPEGNSGVRNAVVVISDFSGFSRTVTTGTFGRFQFEGINPGNTYLISVKSRRYTYTEQLVTLNENISDLQFVGQTQGP